MTRQQKQMNEAKAIQNDIRELLDGMKAQGHGKLKQLAVLCIAVPVAIWTIKKHV